MAASVVIIYGSTTPARTCLCVLYALSLESNVDVVANPIHLCVGNKTQMYGFFSLEFLRLNGSLLQFQ